MFRLKAVWSLVGMILAAAASLQAATVYDAAGDYLAGWGAGSNPNGVWSYGWSTTPGSGLLNLYSVAGTDVGYALFDSWHDPNNYISNTPVVYLNNGPTVSDSELHNLPAGALALHGGGTAGSCVVAGDCFSEVVWTAPSTGFVDLAAIFTGRQYRIEGLVEVVDTSGGHSTILLSGLIYDQTSLSLDQLISVQAGDTLTFAAKSNLGLAGDTTQLDATLTYASGVPEPSTFALLLAGLGWLGYRSRRREV